MADVPWGPTLIGTIAGAASTITAYWFTREGGQRPKLEAEAQRFAFDALQQVATTRGDEIDRLVAVVEDLRSEVHTLRGAVEACEARHSRAQAAMASAGIVIDD
jgi:hypothetical protein